MKLLHFASAAMSVAAILAVAAPSQASVTFANFSNVSSKDNFDWTNSGPGGVGGLNATFDNATGAQVHFDFLVGALAGSSILANFTLTAGETGNAATSNGASPPVLTQGGVGGSFDFTAASTTIVDGHTVTAGSTLLSGTFTDGTLTGTKGGGSVTFFDTGSVSFSSPWVNLGPTEDTSFSLTSASPTLGTGLGGPAALKSFDANGGGTFDAGVVPEPATWALMIGGFGMVGYALRRRSVKLAVA